MSKKIASGPVAPASEPTSRYQPISGESDRFPECRLVPAIIRPRDVVRVAREPMTPELVEFIGAMIRHSDQRVACAAATCILILADGKVPDPADFALLEDTDGH